MKKKIPLPKWVTPELKAQCKKIESWTDESGFRFTHIQFKKGAK